MIDSGQPLSRNVTEIAEDRRSVGSSAIEIVGEVFQKIFFITLGLVVGGFIGLIIAVFSGFITIAC